MDDQPYIAFAITDRSEVSLLKKTLKTLGFQVGLSTYQLAKLDIIISEITSNFLKYATRHGEILFRKINRDDIPGIEVISIDHGPGMQDTAHMMRDGVSTTKSLGTGMGAIKRLSDQFDIYSLKGWGTLLLSRVFKEEYSASQAATGIDCATLLLAYPGEAVCGDALSYKSNGNKHTFLLTDGLGHGPHAHEASLQAVEVFQETSSTDPQALIKIIHESIARTRGAVGMVLTLDMLHQTIDYCGVGNISLHMITAEKTKQGISTHGILGQNVRNRLLATQLTWQDDALLILHSDGIKAHWEVKDYPGLRYRELSLMAAAFYKDYKRGKDDCAILAIKLKAVS